ncbi:hypothetical protein HET73_05690 [Wolbachia endosymbiont of Atemnus politus]|uniref:hypothetical protein n=1 Tax=Wolbachia endosymbiont of Atemnus politus TaxID=2682840 RepID=UPI001C552294|nr:hypothetical protein [Wolbachia endosymbiont of Atemnus politus]NSM56853.1 hypothetical protein [Wolbachia endosymbiont of Atemnus politus]
MFKTKRTPILEIDNNQGSFCLFFGLVHFLILITKLDPSTWMTRKGLLALYIRSQCHALG